MLLARVGLVLPATLVLACSLFAAPVVPSEPGASALASSPLPSVVPAPRVVAPRSEAVTIAALRATLGETAEDPAVRALVEILGPPVVRPYKDVVLHRFDAHGVALKFASDGRVASVVLFGDGRSGYRGDLPAGLRFGVGSYEAGRSLGVDIPVREFGRRGDTRLMRPAIEGGRTFRDHGLRLSFRGGALDMVSLIPVATPGSVHLDDAIAYPGEESGVHGLRVYYQLGAGPAPTCAAIDVVARLTDSSGASVRARAVVRRARPEAFMVVDEHVPCRTTDRMLFIPFADLDLPVGHQELRIDLATRPASPGAAPDAARLVAAVQAMASFEMPVVALVRLRVARAEVRRDIFRRRNTAAMLTFGISALGARPKVHPDTFWVFVAGRHHHRSTVRPNTFSPRWTESTAWFSLAEGDTMTLYFADADVGDNERLATFRVGLDQLRAAVRDHTPLAADWVERLELDTSEIREADGAAPRVSH